MCFQRRGFGAHHIDCSQGFSVGEAVAVKKPDWGAVGTPPEDLFASCEDAVVLLLLSEPELCGYDTALMVHSHEDA